MSDHCDIAELLPGGIADCPVCAEARATRIVLDSWDELRAVTSAAEPELLVLHVA